MKNFDASGYSVAVAHYKNAWPAQQSKRNRGYKNSPRGKKIPLYDRGTYEFFIIHDLEMDFQKLTVVSIEFDTSCSRIQSPAIFHARQAIIFVQSLLEGFCTVKRILASWIVTTNTRAMKAANGCHVVFVVNRHALYWNEWDFFSGFAVCIGAQYCIIQKTLEILFKLAYGSSAGSATLQP